MCFPFSVTHKPLKKFLHVGTVHVHVYPIPFGPAQTIDYNPITSYKLLLLVLVIKSACLLKACPPQIPGSSLYAVYTCPIKKLTCSFRKSKNFHVKIICVKI